MRIMSTIKHSIREGVAVDVAVNTTLANTSHDELVAGIRPLVEREARLFARGLTRTLERAAFLPAEPNAISALASSAFVLPDGRWVTWADATVDDHMARARWQRRLASDVLNDALRHEEAVKLIQEAGVTCLAELDAPKVVTEPIQPASRRKQAA